MYRNILLICLIPLGLFSGSSVLAQGESDSLPLPLRQWASESTRQAGTEQWLAALDTLEAFFAPEQTDSSPSPLEARGAAMDLANVAPPFVERHRERFQFVGDQMVIAVHEHLTNVNDTSERGRTLATVFPVFLETVGEWCENDIQRGRLLRALLHTPTLEQYVYNLNRFSDIRLIIELLSHAVVDESTRSLAIDHLQTVMVRFDFWQFYNRARIPSPAERGSTYSGADLVSLFSAFIRANETLIDYGSTLQRDTAIERRARWLARPTSTERDTQLSPFAVAFEFVDRFRSARHDFELVPFFDALHHLVIGEDNVDAKKLLIALTEENGLMERVFREPIAPRVWGIGQLESRAVFLRTLLVPDQGLRSMFAPFISRFVLDPDWQNQVLYPGIGSGEAVLAAARLELNGVVLEIFAAYQNVISAAELRFAVQRQIVSGLAAKTAVEAPSTRAREAADLFLSVVGYSELGGLEVLEVVKGQARQQKREVQATQEVREDLLLSMAQQIRLSILAIRSANEHEQARLIDNLGTMLFAFGRFVAVYGDAGAWFELVRNAGFERSAEAEYLWLTLLLASEHDIPKGQLHSLKRRRLSIQARIEAIDPSLQARIELNASLAREHDFDSRLAMYQESARSLVEANVFLNVAAPLQGWETSTYFPSTLTPEAILRHEMPIFLARVRGNTLLTRYVAESVRLLSW